MTSIDGSAEETKDFGALLDEFYEFEELKRGDIRDAEILMIDKHEIVVDLGVKRDGIVPDTDIDRLDPEMLNSLKVGDSVPVYVLNPSDRDGNLLVSLNLGMQAHDWKRAEGLLESGDLVEAEITGFNPGGALVSFGRTEGFIPNSHLADVLHSAGGDKRDMAMRELIGQKVGLKVIEVNQQRRRLILSQREAQKDWRSQQKASLMGDLAIGDILKGTVTGVRDFGVFVDIGGADGLIHVSELAWYRVPHPSDVVDVGEEIDVYVLELDTDRQRIALSLRRTKPDPWEVVLDTYTIGDVIDGQVSNVVDFGAFVVLPDGIEGLLHITEMGDGSLIEPHSYVQRGDTLSMKIVSIEPEHKRIGFTQKGLDLPAMESILDVVPSMHTEQGFAVGATENDTENKMPLPEEDEDQTEES